MQISRKRRPLDTCETPHWKEEVKIRISEKFGQGFPSEEEHIHLKTSPRSTMAEKQI